MSPSAEKTVSKSLVVLQWTMKAVVAIVTCYLLLNLWFAIGIKCVAPSFWHTIIGVTIMVVGIGTGVIVLDHFVLKKLIDKLSKKVS